MSCIGCFYEGTLKQGALQNHIWNSLKYSHRDPYLSLWLYLTCLLYTFFLLLFFYDLTDTYLYWHLKNIVCFTSSNTTIISILEISNQPAKQSTTTNYKVSLFKCHIWACAHWVTGNFFGDNHMQITDSYPNTIMSNEHNMALLRSFMQS